jgi:integrase/recombinase XerC/integrase/recombinase XerD
MLKIKRVGAAIPAQYLNRARKFYEEKLGLKPTQEQADGVLYMVGETGFLVFPSTGKASGNHTQLALDVEDLDQRNRCAKVRRKGNAVDVIVWQTGTARLLPRLLTGRTTGPVFLTDRRARVVLAPGDVYEPTGQARLSYRRAAELFTATTGGATLHQLRHSALTHAAEDGANTSTLLSYSGHTSVASLARYARVSPEALRRWQQQRDPTSRRR